MSLSDQSFISEKQWEKAIKLLAEGACVGMPTETVYGLAADALNPRGVAKVFETKRRPAFDPLIVHVTLDMGLTKYVKVNETAQKLMDAFWPGPLTILMEKTEIISDLVTSGHPTVALRCPAHPVAQSLLNRYGKPLVAPSANLFGQLSPTSAEAVKMGLGEAISCVLDGGRCQIGLESTIVDSTKVYPQLPVLRLGGISPEKLRLDGFELSYPTPIIGQAPGTLKNHYAPKLPMYLWQSFGEQTREISKTSIDVSTYAWLGWKNHQTDFAQSHILSPQGDSYEAAYQVFAKLREIGESTCEGIIAELPPDEGLGKAIQDRLRRGASGYVHKKQKQWFKCTS